MFNIMARSIFTYIKQSLAIVTLAVQLAACGGYTKGMQQYSSELQSNNYAEAYKKLDNIGSLQNSRNNFIYLAEKGKVARLLGWYDTSNYYLNQADNLLEDTYKKLGETIGSNLVNPMVTTYLAQDYERFMLHYYKALNYIQLQDKDAAVVEARRITLQADRLTEKNMRATDGPGAFAYTLQGIIYEQAGNINDAFISYRNAVDIILAGNASQTNVRLAGEGLLTTAQRIGFVSEYNKYSELLHITTVNTDSAGSVILLHDAGWAPQKENRYFHFNSYIPGNNDLLFTDNNQYNIPVQQTAFASQNNVQAWWFKGLRVATAVPIIISNNGWSGTANVGGSAISFEKIQDLNQLASRPELMKQEIIKAVIRALAKKGVEIAGQETARAIAKSGGDDEKDKGKTDAQKAEEKRKREEKADAIAGGVGLLLNLVNQVSERADTRTWSSLPAGIYAARIPLQKGTNIVTVNGANGTKTMEITATNQLQVMTW